jgi:hypothetical protein
MIIRVVSTVSLILLLILVLYLPSAHPPERFITQLSVEHERNRALWGEHALRILSACSTTGSPIPETLRLLIAAMQSASASRMSQMSERLFNNQFRRSALFVLADIAFPPSSVAAIRFRLRPRRFCGRLHSPHRWQGVSANTPELFALHASVDLNDGGTVVALSRPSPAPTSLTVPANIGIFGSLAANYRLAAPYLGGLKAERSESALSRVQTPLPVAPRLAVVA